MKVEIEKKATVREGVSQRTQKPYKLREQEAYFWFEGERYPKQAMIVLPDEVPDAGYAPGNYEVDFDKSIIIGRFGPEWNFRTYLKAQKAAR